MNKGFNELIQDLMLGKATLNDIYAYSQGEANSRKKKESIEITPEIKAAVDFYTDDGTPITEDTIWIRDIAVFCIKDRSIISDLTLAFTNTLLGSSDEVNTDDINNSGWYISEFYEDGNDARYSHWVYTWKPANNVDNIEDAIHELQSNY